MTKTIVGFIFTSQPVSQLKKLGFRVEQNDSTLKFGYREFICFLSANSGLGISLELREVLDEELYFRFDKRNKFEPFESQIEAIPKDPQNTNTVFQASMVLDEKMENCSLKEQLKIKKIHPLWAICLNAKDISVMPGSGNSLKKIAWRGGEACWIQMGESCFDLVVTTLSFNS